MLDRQQLGWFDMWPALCLLTVLPLSACSIIIDEAGTAVPLSGEAPSSVAHRLNRERLRPIPWAEKRTFGTSAPPWHQLRLAAVRPGVDKAPWAIMAESGDGLRIVRLSSPRQERWHQATALYQTPVTSQLIAATLQGGDIISLQPIAVGEADEAPAVLAPAGGNVIPLVDGLAYRITSGGRLALHFLRRRPGGWVRTVFFWPETEDTGFSGPRAVSKSGSILLHYRAQSLLASNLDNDTETPLGLRTKFLGFLNQQSVALLVNVSGVLGIFDMQRGELQQLSARLDPVDKASDFLEVPAVPWVLLCDASGLRLLNYVNPQMSRSLDSKSCFGPILLYHDQVIYRSGDRVDGSEERRARLGIPGVDPPPEPEPDSLRDTLLASCEHAPDDVVIARRRSSYELGPSPTSAPSDGWIDGWRFMQRGHDVTFDARCERIFFREWTANALGVGELMMAKLPSGEPRTLAHNVLQYARLPDGRILAISNAAFLGTHNRLIAIDLERWKAQWVLDDALWQGRPDTGEVSYYLLDEIHPGSMGLLAELQGSAELFQIQIPDKN